ncbi:MAG TPA: CoA transferase [Candidatus Dormibacteraeota bacterium]
MSDQRPRGRGILAGLQVVEVSAFVAAPLGGATLAALGADVIRVDPLGGGPDRARWPVHLGHSLYWDGLNRGKRSLAIDLGQPQGRELVSRLVTAPGADRGFLLTNLGRRDWLTREVLRRRREDVVVVRIEGNRDGSVAVDYTVNAALGFPWLTGPEATVGPVNHVLPAWDCMTGFLAATALLAAERQRSRTGSGEEVRISLSDVALAVSSHLGLVAEAELEAEPRPRLGNDIYGSFGRDFQTRDRRRLMVVALTPRHWRALVLASGIGEQVEALERRLGADLSDEAERFRHREAIAGLLAEWCLAHDLDEVAARLTAEGAVWGPYQTVQEMVTSDPRLAPGALFERVEEPGLGPHLVARSPLRFDSAPDLAPSPAPRLGEHTREILRDELGLAPAEIKGLEHQGLIG